MHWKRSKEVELSPHLNVRTEESHVYYKKRLDLASFQYESGKISLHII
jgi:hypothetical protein